MPSNNPENETEIRKRCPAQLAAPRRGPPGNALICVILAFSCLASCAKQKVESANAISATVQRGAGAPAAAVSLARKQNWNCPRIRQTIVNLVIAMQAAKVRAEAEEAKSAQTVARMVTRLSSPPGAGNTALAAFQKARRDADQLNDLLREKGCATVPIGVDAPAFLKP